MNDDLFYEGLREYFKELLAKHNLGEENIRITGSILTTEDAIGNPARNDFPLQKGKEKLMQAVFEGCKGQAYTDMPADFTGSLREIAKIPISDNYRRAVFIATINAVLRKMDLAGNTVHCKDDGPKKCGEKLTAMIADQYGDPKIALFGFQPAMAEAIAPRFSLRIFDIDQDNIGKKKFGVTVESGFSDLAEVQKWADLFLVTGSTLGNGTIVDFLEIDKPVIFYGTTIAGAAEICGLTRFCPESA
ncbi:MAG: Rossmann-like domain-containing protein [Peptococcaceae bacterium]